MKKTMLIVALLLSTVLIDENVGHTIGVYAVDKAATTAKNFVSGQYGLKDVVLVTANFAPLVVEGKPEVNRGPRGSWLKVQLAPEAAKRLEDLTRSHIDRAIAVVVGDKILSAPTVRSVITDGKARVTPCEDESCETLLRELSK